MKKITTALFTILLLFSLCMTTFAADITNPGGAGQVPVSLTVVPARFSVTVPVALPVSVDAYGSITTASNVKIVNNGHGSVRVANMTVTPVGDWSIVDYYGFDIYAEKVGAKKVASTATIRHPRVRSLLPRLIFRRCMEQTPRQAMNWQYSMMR